MRKMLKTRTYKNKQTRFLLSQMRKSLQLSHIHVYSLIKCREYSDNCCIFMNADCLLLTLTIGTLGRLCFPCCPSDNWPIDNPPSCPGLHDLRIACLNTYYNMKAISFHYNITKPIIGLGDGDSDLHRYDWQVNTIDGPTKLVRQDAILGGLSIGQLAGHWAA